MKVNPAGLKKFATNERCLCTTVSSTKLLVRLGFVVFYGRANLLIGRDFNPEVTLTVSAQVDKLIEQATALENLCQCFSGWCAFW